MSEDPPVPLEVRTAAQRLAARHAAAQQIPQVFQDIIKNNKRSAEIMEHGYVMSQADWRELKELRRDLRESLIPGAEQMLKWNKDKGNLKG